MREEYKKLANSLMLRSAFAILTIIASSVSMPINQGIFKVIYFALILISLVMGTFASFALHNEDRKFMYALFVLAPISALIIATRKTYLASIVWAIVLIALDSAAVCYAKPWFKNRVTRDEEAHEVNRELEDDFEVDRELEDDFELNEELKEIHDEPNDETVEELDDETVELEPIKRDDKLRMSDILSSKYLDSLNEKEQK